VTVFAGQKEMLERISNMSEEASLEEILKTFSFIEEPLNDHLFIKIDNFQYTGKIVIPEQNKRMPTKGLVVAVASSITNIKVGDRVLYSQFAGYLLKFGDVPVCRCLGYSELLGRLRPDAPILTVEGA
jgi:co-chaperonin GroES (HSP10)